MQWKPEEIGRLGFKIGHSFDMATFTLWRRGDHWDMDIFTMTENDGAVSQTTPMSFEQGDALVTEIYDGGQLASWEKRYNPAGADDGAFTWSLDIATPDETSLFLSHGKGGMPPKDQFAKVVAAVRSAYPGFGTAYDSEMV